jgi:hypothetical protein
VRWAASKGRLSLNRPPAIRAGAATKTEAVSAKNIEIIYFPVGDRRKAILQMLIQGFDVFGIHIQYWMVIVALIVVGAVVDSIWKKRL